MPILHRHVVPNVPAWTADNGKIVFGAGGAPSHRAEMRLSITFGGSIEFTSGLWNGPSSLAVFENSWTGAGVYDSYHGYVHPWNYGEADIVTADGWHEARRRIDGGQVTHTEPGGNWRATGWFFNGTYYDNGAQVGSFEAALRGGAFCLDHTWDARGNAAPWTVRVRFDHNWDINPAHYDEHLWPDGLSGIAPVQLWVPGEPEYDPDHGSWSYPNILAGAIIVPYNNPVLKWDCADMWPSDGFRLGTTHRFYYSGYIGKGIDISNTYIDITASYA